MGLAHCAKPLVAFGASLWEAEQWVLSSSDSAPEMGGFFVF
ncbi:hypothetical protein FRUB_04594 [Fimbriiglobus ruber]|uniref:Uncharacterized protein n=1 Tax=Fimbriiglobus ruber TaxID=1908690 RepID=A0A225DIF8_9BACT|nr:hypothetical protein FRUB_04594 [Fimbriiglobus ruber]